MSQPFRFVHASDFHLEKPLRTVADAPEQLASLLTESRYRAAQRVFDLALTSRADFLVLAGDIVQVERAGPRALHFLSAQFTRLAEQGVAVYWAGGRSERMSGWPDDLPLPPNVHLFARGEAQPRIHYDEKAPLAQLIGTSAVLRDGTLALDAFAHRKGAGAAPEGSRRGKGPLFTIGVAHGKLTNDRAAGKLAIDYWALGGSHRRRRTRIVRRLERSGTNGATTTPAQAVYSGAPQGGAIHEQGPHGAIVVQVDEQGAAHAQFAPTDLVRWRRVKLPLDGALSLAEVEQRLESRAETELTHAPTHDHFLHWTIEQTGDHRPAWAGDHGRAELLAWLRRTYSNRAPVAWSVALDVNRPAAARSIVAPDQTADGTLLADFLIAVDAFASEGADVPWTKMLPDALRDSSVAATLTKSIDPATRRKLLEEVAVLGRELLGGEEVAQ